MVRTLTLLLVLGMAASAALAVEDLNPTEENSWAFPTTIDPWARSPIDLRHLNEEVAGQSGFIRRSEDGGGFVRGDGEPIRFWAVGGGIRRWSDEEATAAARWRARMGVNMARVGGTLNPKHEGAAITDVDEKVLDGMWRAVAVYKQEGIYTNISPWWAYPWNVRYIPPEWGIEGIGGEQPGAFGAIFFDPTLQEAYRNWMRRLLTDVNPYTGIALRDDPALAIIQIQNEDSLLFHTIKNLAAGPRKIMEKQFHDWAVERYGSLEATLAAWDGQAVEGDDPDAGRLGVMNIWFLTDDGRGQMNEQRVRDTFRFLTEVQRNFYADMRRFISEDLGCPHLIDASNFKPADKRYMDDAERWTFTVVDTIANNDYYDGAVHVGDHAGYMIEGGDHFTARSATQALRLPVGKKQVVGHPFIITETLWVPPMPYVAEGPVLLAAYGGMNGIDAITWNAPQRPTWAHGSPHRPWVPDEGQGHAFSKWDCTDPGAMSTFPAAALIYRQGLVTPGPVVIREARSLDSMFAREEPVISEGFSFDPNRHTLEEAIRAEARQSDGLAFLVGRVEALYDADPALTEVMDISPYVDATGVRSATGELALRPDPGLFTLDAPRAQGVTGFLGAAGGRFELSDVTIESADTFASVTLVPLDGEPLVQSRQVLVQIGTLARPSGWRTEPATFQRREQELEGLRIAHTGTLPWRVANTDVTVTIRNSNLTKATLLDPNGLPVRVLEVQAGETGLTIPCPPESMYILVE